MAEDRRSSLKNISIVSGTTILSRVFGFLRDMTFFSFFGLSEIGAAFLLAFTFPNLFRRLLGEGALASAIVPILSSQYATYGKDSMLKLFSHIVLRLFLVLCCVLGLLYAVILLVSGKMADSRWNMAFGFIAALLPYMAFVCIAAVIAAALNVLGKFFIASINQVWMNFSMILSLLIGEFCFHLNGIRLVNCLIVGVIVGGMTQLLVPLVTISMLGWRPKLDGNIPNLEKSMSDVLRLFLPGIFGAAIEQLNILVSRTIAYSFSAAAVPLLYLANRLVELPTGVFGLAITTVFFPRMAKVIGSKADATVINETFNSCLVAMMWILLPSTVGLFALKHEILSLFFERGNFTATDISRTLPIVSVYCVGMAFSGASSLFIRGFHSLKDTKTPALIGVIVLVTNASLALSLVRFFGVVGLAVATTTATIFQATFLAIALKRKMHELSILSESKSYAAIFRGCAAMAIAVIVAKIFTKSCFHPSRPVGDLLTIIFSVPLALLVYLSASRRLIARVFARGKVP
ncbi:MAG: murein biosynthesis integral membrane protein MurJ [Puniceicoccales bacterium]|jgi:putative peptidoglycan lipid II flippase|nr:murein biosynthesis integral membrane protein MurJ [Puniceicoccales bacterium]